MEQISNIDMAATGKNIIRLREQNNLTVKDLQRMLGFSTPQAIYKWQQGATLPSIDNLLILSKIFHASMEEILVVEKKT